MRKFAAHYLFTGNEKPIAKGIVQVDSSGLILDIARPIGRFREEAGLEFHNGIICPAFVNVYHEFEPERFYRKFPELLPFESLCPERLNTEKDLLGWLKAIQLTSKHINLEQLIRLFTLDSAKSISLNKELGSIEKGKRPGLMLISGMDYHKLRLTENSYLKMLI